MNVIELDTGFVSGEISVQENSNDRKDRWKNIDFGLIQKLTER